MALTPPTPQEELKEGIKSYLHQVLDAEAQKDTLSGKAARFVLEEPPDAGLQAYIRAAFLYVVVVPQERAAEVLKLAQGIDDREGKMVPLIMKSKSLTKAIQIFNRI